MNNKNKQFNSPSVKAANIRELTLPCEVSVVLFSCLHDRESSHVDERMCSRVLVVAHVLA